NGEPHVLVVTWKQNISYYKPYLNTTYNTGIHPIWVTAAPDLLQKINAKKVRNIDLRLKQLLGLPPTSEYSYFVEFWVQPKDLFRPCPDNEISDQKCNLCFSDKAKAEYIAWMNKNRIDRYYQCEWNDKYPWTQLGYTYDWNPKNKSHVGLSEFVIGSNKNIVVNAIYTTEEYLKKNFQTK
ncbi:MAG: hypothetical protein AAF617_17565, partial [Bacteroidota bacterium]